MCVHQNAVSSNRAMIKVVREENAQYIAHGATGKGNDQIRFELSAYALHPKIKVRERERTIL